MMPTTASHSRRPYLLWSDEHSTVSADPDKWSRRTLTSYEKVRAKQCTWIVTPGTNAQWVNVFCEMRPGASTGSSQDLPTTPRLCSLQHRLGFQVVQPRGGQGRSVSHHPHARTLLSLGSGQKPDWQCPFQWGVTFVSSRWKSMLLVPVHQMQGSIGAREQTTPPPTFPVLRST